MKIKCENDLGMMVYFSPDERYSTGYKRYVKFGVNKGTMLRHLRWGFFRLSLRSMLYYIWDDYLRPVILRDSEGDWCFTWLSFEIIWSNG